MITDLSFLEGGRFTSIDQEVRSVAQKLVSSGQTTFKLKKISEFVSALKHKNPTTEFRKRTGSEILKSGYSTGCTDTALAFIVISRFVGIPTRYVETVAEEWLSGKGDSRPIDGHIFVDVLVDGEWRVYDPISGFTPNNKYVLMQNNSKVYIEIGKGLDFSEIYVKDKGSYRDSPTNIQDVNLLISFRQKSKSNE